MQNQDNQKEIDLMKYWEVIVKRKWVIIIFTGAIIFFVGVFSFLAIPQYKSTATLLIEEGSTRMLSIEETFSYQTPVAGYDDQGAFRTDTKYSVTTSRQINQYLGGKDVGRTVTQDYINSLVEVA